MKYITETRDFQIQEPTVVTMGKFDGRHRGHQKLLKAMMEFRRERGWKTAIFTFSSTPKAVVEKQAQTVITTNQERRNNLEKIGIDYLIEYPFTEEVSHMPPEDFVKTILVGQMNARAIVVGTDCGFGYKRAGDVTLLSKLAKELGYELEVIVKEKDEEREISSTYVREELDQGNIKKANELLGEPYAIHGTVVHGNHIGGGILGFPTANIIPPPEKHLPRFGVYVSRVLIDGRSFGGVTNIGRKPTIEGVSPVGVETFIYGLHEDLYGKNIEVQLLDFIRPECKFQSLKELKEQIQRDKERGEIYFQKIIDKKITL